MGFLAVYVWLSVANLVLAGWCFGLRHCDPETALRGMYVAFLIWEALTLWSWQRLTGRLFDVYSLTATALWLFNGGGLAVGLILEDDPWIVVHALRLPVLRDFHDATVLVAFQLTLYCLTALHLCAMLVVPPTPRPAEHRTRPAQRDPYLAWAGGALIAVSLGPAALMVRDLLVRVAEGGYMAIYQGAEGGGDPWYFQLASGLVPGAFFLAGSDLDNRRRRWAAWGLVSGFSLAILVLGTRATFYQCMIALLWLQHQGVRRIRKVVWIGLMATGAILSSVVFLSRESAGKAAMNLDAVRLAGAEALRNVGEPFIEMGSSIMTVTYTLELVPRERDYCRGESYAHALLAGLPQAITGEYIANRDTEESWLIQRVSAQTARISGGLGFSLIAEAYLNVGMFAPLVLGAAGAVLARFATWSHAAGRSGRLALAACVLSMILFGARASSLSFVRRTLWLCVVPYAAAACWQWVEGRVGLSLPDPRATEGSTE